jgi:uncharacterized protein
MILDLFILIIGGCLGGFMAGLLGVGGGMIFIPFIQYMLSDFSDISDSEIVKFTLANSIGLVFLSGISGISRQVKLKIYSFKNSLYIGIPGAIAASIMNLAIQNGNWYVKSDFQKVFLLFLILSILNMIFGKQNTELEQNDIGKKILAKIVLGLLAGTVVALSGLGGGIIMVPLIRYLLKKPIHEATSLSLSIVPLLSLVPVIQNMTAKNVPQLIQNGYNFPQSGYIIWPYFVPLAIGVIFFSSFGQKIAQKVPVLWLRVIFAVLSTIILIKTLYEIF